MIAKRLTSNRLRKAVLGCIFAVIGLFGLSAPVSAVDMHETRVEVAVETTETNNDTTDANSDASDANNSSPEAEDEAKKKEEEEKRKEEEEKKKEAEAVENGITCERSLGALGWLVCPTTGKISEAVDFLYDKIENILVINPVEIKDGAPIYEIWKYAKGITNLVFIIFFLIVIYSQITGVGISNYGIKKTLPKIIVVAILVNLSFIMCSFLVDISNIVGNGLRSMFASIEASTLTTMSTGLVRNVSMSQMYLALASGGALTIGALVVAFETGAIWMLVPVVLGALVAVASGLITIAMRQAVVALLIMISPLAIVAYMLPNTEHLFKKWKGLFTRMLVFYPLFSLLFGASSLAGWAIITSAKDGFTLMLGVAVQIFPLFFSWSLMKMSGTFLSTINSKLQGLASRPLTANRAWADSKRQLRKQKTLSSGHAYTPSARLMQYLSDRKALRDEETAEHANTARLRSQAYVAMKNYHKNGTPTREGEEAYEMQLRNIRYARKIDEHKNNMNMGLGQLAAVQLHSSDAQKARLENLDNLTVKEVDKAFAEKARGEMIERDNAEGRYKRFEAAMNVHMDDTLGYKVDSDTGIRAPRDDYKFHFDSIRAGDAAREKYEDIKGVMEGNELNVQYAAASAAQAYDTQAKIINTKFQKYFELIPPTQDVDNRLREFSRHVSADPNFKVSNNIDTIISGLRVINQRGDTDIVKNIIDDVLDKKYGGLQLGTHASQALASFLMFEVKDNDPFLRRFGKYINLETANVYNENKRKEMAITYDEYVKGYHDEPDGNRMYAKKAMKKLVEGTSLDNIERTALANLDESLKKAYGLDPNDSETRKTWDVAGYLRKRDEIQTAFEPAFLSASLKWLSGSEQISSAVKFWTGYDLKQQKDKDGKNIVDKNGDPVYDLTPVWEGKEFADHEDEVKDYYRKKTMDYFKDQTTGQILGMRTDYRDATMEHLLETYLNGDPKEKLTDEQKEMYDERKRQYEEARAEIQSRYGDEEDPAKAKEKRDKDLKKLKMELAGRQVRKILGETGKLKQIYRTRTSGTAINAKDWLRGWVNLDNEDALRDEMNYFDRKHREEAEKLRELEKERRGADSGEESETVGRIYNEDDRERFVNEMQDLKDNILDEEPDIFFEDTRAKLVEWFGEETEIVKKYEHFHEVEDPSADNLELYRFVKELLSDLNNYPDA